MNTTKTNKIVVGLLGGVMALSFAFSSVAGAQALTPAEQALLQSLMARSSASTVVAAPSAFTRDLTLGSAGADVKQLQQWLNANGYAVATSGVGSAGHESTSFGAKTKAALAAYQTAK